MSRATLAIAAALVAAPAAAAAQEPTEVIVERADARPSLGVGLVVGTTIGLAAKYYLSAASAIAVGVGSYNFHPGVSAQADWILQPATLTRTPELTVPLYLGAGARVSHWEHAEHMHTDLAVRFPVGLAAELGVAPIDFFVEGALDVNVVSNQAHRRTALTAAIGSRYFF